MQMAETAESCLAPVKDFRTVEGWDGTESAAERSRWCCAQLEENRILYFERLPYDFPADDRTFLVSHRLGDSRLHKNILYRPKEDKLRGLAASDPEASHRMREVMRRYSRAVTRFLSRLLAPYAIHWSLDYASFRPEEEQGRKLPLRKRNDLLHTDAFPSRPTGGGRILRCFTNINPSAGRVWQTTDSFPELAGRYALAAGLAELAAGHDSSLRGLWRRLGRAVGLRLKAHTPYDKFMLRFHDYLKENNSFQRDCPKIGLEFPPGSTWICFTDSVPHAVLRGQYAVEQTVIVPLAAMVRPQRSPLRVLETLAGRPLI